MDKHTEKNLTKIYKDTLTIHIHMDKQEFIEQYKDDWSKTNILDIVYGDLVEYCREHDIDEDEISTEELEEIADHMVQEGEF